jgi:lipoprotein-anchoring transpeptidase ErfK/SrfK
MNKVIAPSGLLVIFLLIAGLPLLGPGMALADGTKTIKVDIERQKLWAYEGDDLIYEYHVVTGRCAKQTAPGTYYIGRKIEDYTSKTYGSPMPYTMFFSEDGKAIHGTVFATLRSFVFVYITENVGSQGCVGLRRGNARRMFEWAPTGTPIIIIDIDPDA